MSLISLCQLLQAKFDLKLPPYAGSDQVVKLNTAAVGLDPSQVALKVAPDERIPFQNLSARS